MSNEDKDKLVTVMVNARPVQVDKHEELTFREVVILAEGEFSIDPNVTYTVTYKKDKHESAVDMVDGGKPVKPHEGMSFSVTKTDKS